MRDRYLRKIACIVKQSQLEQGKQEHADVLIRRLTRCESRITNRRLLEQLLKLLLS